MSDRCTECGAPMVCLADRLEVELADLAAVVDLAMRQVRLRYASADVAEAYSELVAERGRNIVSWAELQSRRNLEEAA